MFQNKDWKTISYNGYLNSENFKNHVAKVAEISGSLQLPYHNIDHCKFVALTSGKKAEELGFPAAPFIVAGMWHDANHTGDSSLPDNRNIIRAMDAFWDNGRFIDNFDKNFNRLVIRLILYTMSPRKRNVGVSKFEGIMRNSDMSQTGIEGWAERFERETGIQALSFSGLFFYNIDDLSKNKGWK